MTVRGVSSQKVPHELADYRGNCRVRAGERRAVSFGDSDLKLTVSGGRWFESTQLYQRNQILKTFSQ